MEDFDMADQTRQPRKAAQPHPPEPHNQPPTTRPPTTNAPDHPRKETHPLAPSLNTQSQTRLSAAETAGTPHGTTTIEPAPTAKQTSKTKGSFSKLLDTVWEEACREREAKKRGVAALMLALDQFEANPGLSKEEKTARLEADSLLKEVKEL
ncbi:hypothetical protein Cpir12675_006277, partial [Ceratocystis pirilliformis]